MGLFIVSLNRVDLFSLCGLALALSAIVLILSERFSLSLATLLAAMVIDFMDGYLARALGLTRAFGKYLDSFIDVVIYLIAPALFLYQWGFNQPYHLPILLVFVAMGIVRLSVFNEIGNLKNEEGELAYLGMPVFWSLFILSAAQVSSWLIRKEFVLVVLATVLPVYSLLMVYNRNFYKFNNPIKLSAFLLATGLAFVFMDFNNYK